MVEDKDSKADGGGNEGGECSPNDPKDPKDPKEKVTRNTFTNEERKAIRHQYYFSGQTISQSEVRQWFQKQYNREVSQPVVSRILSDKYLDLDEGKVIPERFHNMKKPFTKQTVVPCGFDELDSQLLKWFNQETNSNSNRQQVLQKAKQIWKTIPEYKSDASKSVDLLDSNWVQDFLKRHGLKEVKEAKEAKESKQPKEPKKAKESKDSKEPKEPKEAKESKKPKETKESKASKASKDPKESKGSMATKDPKESNQQQQCEDKPPPKKKHKANNNTNTDQKSKPKQPANKAKPKAKAKPASTPVPTSVPVPVPSPAPPSPSPLSAVTAKKVSASSPLPPPASKLHSSRFNPINTAKNLKLANELNIGNGDPNTNTIQHMANGHTNSPAKKIITSKEAKQCLELLMEYETYTTNDPSVRHFYNQRIEAIANQHQQQNGSQE